MTAAEATTDTFEKIVPIPKIEIGALRRHLEAASEPFIVEGMITDWAASRNWSLDSFKERFGATNVDVALDLPTSGAPYDQVWSEHNSEMTLAAFIDHLRACPADKPCYMAEKPLLKFFPELAAELDFETLVPPDGHEANTYVWIGSAGTRSGLHFDRFSNLFGQVVGRKIVTFVAPHHIKHLYPYRNYIQKSQVDPEAPDFRRFPKLRQVTVMQGEVGPGDGMFIPKLWWHFLRSAEPSISANHWFGKSADLKEQLGMVLASGPAGIAQTLVDFLRLGLLRRPYRNRLFSEAPTGKFLYQQTIGYRLGQ